MKTIKINEGIELNIIKTEKFKTNYISISFVKKLERENITKDNLIPLVLKRGTNKLPNMTLISEKLDDLYGATLGTSCDKLGDNTLLQFDTEFIENKFALDGEDILKEAILLLNDVVFNPILEYGHFKDEYVVSEKETLREIIESKINDKGSYAMDRCTEEMFKEEPFGIYKNGYVEDLEKINSENLYEEYIEILKNSKVIIYAVGNFDETFVENIVRDTFNGLNRTYADKKVVDNRIFADCFEDAKVIEEQNLTQGKLVLGYRLDDIDLVDDYYKMLVYSAILGGTASAKLFMNVREKKSLAYTIRSIYLKHKGTLFVTAGIDISNYEIALDAILKEMEDMKTGNITEEELNSAKVNLVTQYKSFADSEGAMAGFDLGQKLLGGDEEIDILISRINEVSLQDVVEVANKLRRQMVYFLK